MDEQTARALREKARTTAAVERVTQLVEDKKQKLSKAQEKIKELSLKTTALAVETAGAKLGLLIAKRQGDPEMEKQALEKVEHIIAQQKPAKQEMSPLRERFLVVQKALAETKTELKKATDTLRGRCSTMEAQLQELTEAVVHDEKLLNKARWKFATSSEGVIHLVSNTIKLEKDQSVLSSSFSMKDVSPVKEGEKQGSLFCYINEERHKEDEVKPISMPISMTLSFDSYEQMFNVIKAWNLIVDLRPLQEIKKELAQDLLVIQGGSRDYQVPEEILELEKKDKEEAEKKAAEAQQRIQDAIDNGFKKSQENKKEGKEESFTFEEMVTQLGEDAPVEALSFLDRMEIEQNFPPLDLD